ncbi:MAG: IS5 family transposase, partial [Xanthobacteraceae bacterium]
AAHRDAVARFAGTLWAIHDSVQSLQPLVQTRHLEADFRRPGIEIARQSVSDRQHDCESPSCGQRGKRGEQNQAIGISRGGRTTKIHALVDSKGRPLNFTVTGGQVHDSQVVGDVLDTPRPPLAVTADKAYDSDRVRQQIKDEGALPIIPSRSNATKKAYCPKRFYRRRHKIENYFCRIKDWRRIATRYDKLARNFLAAAALVAALYWIKL